MRSINGSPGITQEALTTLATKAKEYESEGKPLLISMMSDEVFIRKDVVWKEESKKFTGFVTCLDNNNNNNTNRKELPVAKNALVFMAVGDGFKLTVGYFFLSGLNAQNRAAPTQLAIESVNKAGARVISLTGDGLIANVSMVKELGADFKNDKPYFPSPTDPDDKIYVIWDPPHMLKLARGCLKSHQLYHDDIPIQWNFISSLHEMQKQRNINLGNKLTSMHCNFHVKPMNVRLAAETLSNSVAMGIELLSKDGYEQFKDSHKTSEFIRYVNNTFDILNFKPSIGKAGVNFRKPLNTSTASEVFEYATKAKAFFESIEIDEIYTRRLEDGTRKYTLLENWL